MIAAPIRLLLAPAFARAVTLPSVVVDLAAVGTSRPVPREGAVMAGTGAVLKRCGCRDPETKKRLERDCPRLQERRHGSWSFHCWVTTMFGGRERVRRGGYATRRDAEAARDDVLEQSRTGCTTCATARRSWRTRPAPI